MRRVLLLAAIGLLTSCGSTSVGENPTLAPLATPPSSASDDVSCGDVVLDQGEQLTVAAAAELACLDRALEESRRAALTVTTPTAEGDPIVTSWQLTYDGTLTADIDSSKDRFGSEEHSHVSCGTVTELPDLTTCGRQQ
ncbi:hypothetical protein [Knoellia sp. Soil729]|uniref:hypothetical protein n=1 Tax=Knoellia sp. Soil729 TaxID=1736394 RepID=UPI0006FC67FE|nr:hypothetical protein [Knoellia sp. Soil729]KRE41003.1 hypothetical protein ASG74_14110 [Knoellia sp. Soil729]